MLIRSISPTLAKPIPMAKALSHDEPVQRLAIGGRESLGIVEPLGHIGRVEDNGCGGNRPGQGTAARFVDAGHEFIAGDEQAFFKLEMRRQHSLLLAA